MIKLSVRVRGAGPTCWLQEADLVASTEISYDEFVVAAQAMIPRAGPLAQKISRLRYGGSEAWLLAEHNAIASVLSGIGDQKFVQETIPHLQPNKNSIFLTATPLPGSCPWGPPLPEEYPVPMPRRELDILIGCCYFPVDMGKVLNVVFAAASRPIVSEDCAIIARELIHHQVRVARWSVKPGQYPITWRW